MAVLIKYINKIGALESFCGIEDGKRAVKACVLVIERNGLWSRNNYGMKPHAWTLVTILKISNKGFGGGEDEKRGANVWARNRKESFVK